MKKTTLILLGISIFALIEVRSVYAYLTDKLMEDNNFKIPKNIEDKLNEGGLELLETRIELSLYDKNENIDYFLIAVYATKEEVADINEKRKTREDVVGKALIIFDYKKKTVLNFVYKKCGRKPDDYKQKQKPEKQKKI